MTINKFCLFITFFASFSFLQAQPKMLDVPVTIMKNTELKIERGGCFVYWRPIYCTYPGSGYTLETMNSSRSSENTISQFSVRLDSNNALNWYASRKDSPRSEAKVCIMGRTELRVILQGSPGSGIVLGIHGEPGQVDLANFRGGVHFYTQVEQQNARMQAMIPQWGAPPDPTPTVSLKADRTAITIGEAVRLSWDAQNAKSILFSSPDLGVVAASGSALVWPEKDTLFRIEAISRSGTVKAEVIVKVAVPEPELEISLDPEKVDEGQETTLIWKTKNARFVRLANSQFSSLPLSGKMRIKPNRYIPIELQAENGEKKVRKSTSANVADMKAEKQRAEDEKASRSIPKKIDETLHGIWDELKAALRAGNAVKAASFFSQETRAGYLEMYKALKDTLPQIGAEMREIEFLSFEGNAAIYRIKRKETIQGKEYDISYRVHFVIDQDGQWRIYRL